MEDTGSDCLDDTESPVSEAMSVSMPDYKGERKVSDVCKNNFLNVDGRSNFTNGTTKLLVF